MSRPWTPGPWEYDGYQVVWPDAPQPPNRYMLDPETKRKIPLHYDDERRTYGYGNDNNFVADLNDGEYHEYASKVEQDANGRLIALAPEMAEAIIWGSCDAFNPENGEHECGCPLCVVASKLRRIETQDA